MSVTELPDRPRRKGTVTVILLLGKIAGPIDIHHHASVMMSGSAVVVEDETGHVVVYSPSAYKTVDFEQDEEQ